MSLSPREMLARLVAFPSISTSSNLDIIHFCRDWLNSHGVESRMVMSPEGDKANLYATIGPQVEGGIVLSGHTDVVPVEGQNWTTDPWTLTEKNGRLYGRGATDMKGFDALVLALVPEMVRAPLKRPIHIALSYDEEIACRGAPSMVKAMAETIPAPSAVIVGEPTRHAVVTGHKASVQLRTQVTGYAIHSSRIDQGVSAVMNAARLIAWHEDVMEENRRNADPGNPFEPPYTTLHCGMMAGGNAANVVSSSAWFFSDIRAIPTESPMDYLARYEAYIREMIEPRMKAIAPDTGVAVELIAEVPGLRPETDGAAERLMRRLTGDNGTHVVSYGTEAGLFQRVGWSTVVCGPGDIAQAHQPDEYIEVSEFQAGEATLRRLIGDLCA
ncbi:acetylornithine deacetylase [Microvirga lotononidis]|uniref:Acetylornithine deacetylase ArgE n=1 Tax=Microvirga lotononidis TaxID=864069 RepID=I4YZW8_9HYPH|nr:acetylornithine deacetylase [Microvirga lotononidis]EIM29510.1 acetylornithine deacetylase ArgE [Microvirga lotononidis]WQO27177.1 acetylornithine deacetylase [Microvirga lotononidis]